MARIAVVGTDSVASLVAASLGLASPLPTIFDLCDAADVVPPDVVIVSAEAHLDRLAPTLRECLHRKQHVVAACEEMSWPWYGHPHLGDVLNNESARAGVAVLGVSSLVFEALPLLTAAAMDDLRSLRIVTRTAPRHLRAGVAQRLGLGMPAARWKTLRAAKTVGLIGVGECVTLLAQGLGRHPMHSDVTLQVTPVADADGNVAGVRTVGRYAVEGLTVECTFESSADVSDATQHVTIEGEKTVELAVNPAAGPATLAARLIQAAGHVASLTPGLHTVLDLPRTTTDAGNHA